MMYYIYTIYMMHNYLCMGEFLVTFYYVIIWVHRIEKLHLTPFNLWADMRALFIIASYTQGRSNTLVLNRSQVPK